MAQLEFSHVHSYAQRPGGISAPVSLSSGAETVEFLAYIDTGASDCLFERQHGEVLNLDIETGEPVIFQAANGGVEAFGHMVSLEVLGLRFESMVYFFADDGIRKNLLGRAGWLDRIRFGLVDYDSKFYIAPYDFESSDPADTIV
ncbi:MAG TPA: retropepsin-like aspartic protease [Bryobacteraceae bacterium]|jgi:hypothetical protein